MRVTQKVRKILDNYESDSPATKANLARLLCTGKTAGTGKMIILPVDQGFEHGPARSFAMNPDAYNPQYHHKLAVDGGCSAYAAPLGMLEASADTFAGSVPLIMKMNSANSLYKNPDAPTQAVTATVRDAVRLGCSAVGYTIYPGSEEIYSMLEELRELIEEAKAYGLAAVVWSYARGKTVSKEGELAIDVIGYGAHMACLMGAHVIKVKLPSDFMDQDESAKAIKDNKVVIKTQADRVRHIVQSCFNGRRMVVFSGGSKKGANSVLEDAIAIRDGGGNGSIIGRNCFQRPRKESLELLNNIAKVYLGKDDDLRMAA